LNQTFHQKEAEDPFEDDEPEPGASHITERRICDEKPRANIAIPKKHINATRLGGEITLDEE
jgi:hypothetical protein